MEEALSSISSATTTTTTTTADNNSSSNNDNINNASNVSSHQFRSASRLKAQKTLAPRTAAVMGNPSSSSFTVIASPPPPPPPQTNIKTDEVEPPADLYQQRDDDSNSSSSLASSSLQQSSFTASPSVKLFSQKALAPRTSAVAIISTSIPPPPSQILPIHEETPPPPPTEFQKQQQDAEHAEETPARTTINEANDDDDLKRRIIIAERIHRQQIDLLEWEESTLRASLEHSISTTLVRLFATGALDAAMGYAAFDLAQQHKLVCFFDLEEFRRKVMIEDVEQQVFTNFIHLTSGIEQVQLDEASIRRRSFDQDVLGALHPSFVLECHHQYLAAGYAFELRVLSAARDVKLAEQACLDICDKEFDARRELLQEENRKWILDLNLAASSEVLARMRIVAEEASVREAEWACPVCAVLRPAKNSMLAEINASMPIRGAEMLQLHILHHAADVARRQIIRSATLREEFAARNHLEFAAFGGVLSATFECQRGALLMGEESARRRRIEDPAVWKASIRAAIDATRQRQVDERWSIERQECLARLEEIDEEYTRGLSQEILLGMEVLDFFTELMNNNNTDDYESNYHNNNNLSDFDDNDEENRFTNFSASGLFSSADAVEVHSNSSKGFAIVCRNNIDTVRALFEERILSQQPLREAERQLDAQRHEPLPALPVEASHVRRKMGTDEAVADSDRFMFIKGGIGAGAASSSSPPSSPTKSSSSKKNSSSKDKKLVKNSDVASSVDYFGPSVDALFAHFADETERRRAKARKQHEGDEEGENDEQQKQRYNLASFGAGAGYGDSDEDDDDDDDDDDFVFDDDEDFLFDQQHQHHQRQFNEDEFFENLLLNKKERRRKRLLGKNQNDNNDDDDDDYASVDSDQLFELELALDELQRKEIGARRVVIDLEWHKRVMLEKRLAAMPVAKLSIPKCERDLIALQKIEPFHRGQLMREAMSERERVHILFHNEKRRVEKSVRQQLGNAAMNNRPPFRGGGVALAPTPPVSSSSTSTATTSSSSLMNRPSSSSARGKSSSFFLKEQHQQQRPPSPPAQHQHQKYLGHPTDRMMSSVLRLEAQLLHLFESVSARRRGLALDYMRIECERQELKDEAMRQAGDAPSWTTMPFTFQPRHPKTAAATAQYQQYHQNDKENETTHHLRSQSNNNNNNNNFYRGRRRSLPTPSSTMAHQQNDVSLTSNHRGANNNNIYNVNRPASARR